MRAKVRLGHPSTLRRWEKRGRIPWFRGFDVFHAAKVHDVRISASLKRRLFPRRAIKVAAVRRSPWSSPVKRARMLAGIRAAARRRKLAGKWSHRGRKEMR